MPRNSPRSLACPPLAPPAPHCAPPHAHSQFFFWRFRRASARVGAMRCCGGARSLRTFGIQSNNVWRECSQRAHTQNQRDSVRRRDALRHMQIARMESAQQRARARSLTPRARAPHSRITRRRAAFERTAKKNSTVIIGVKMGWNWSLGFERVAGVSLVTHLFLTCANW